MKFSQLAILAGASVAIAQSGKNVAVYVDPNGKTLCVDYNYTPTPSQPAPSLAAQPSGNLPASNDENTYPSTLPQGVSLAPSSAPSEPDSAPSSPMTNAPEQAAPSAMPYYGNSSYSSNYSTSSAGDAQPWLVSVTPINSAASAPTSAPASSGSPSSAPSTSTSGEVFSGDATFYYPSVGACGQHSSPDDYIVALNGPQFLAVHQGNPNNNPLCGRRIRVHRGSSSVDVTILDYCPECKHGDVDLSPAAFDKLAQRVEGRVKVTWSFI